MGGACCGDASATSQPQNKPKDSGDKFEKAVNTIFDKYDVDKSGYLDKNELSKVINAALSDMEGGRAAKQEEIE
jgi:Ca2+-binding EF-hand superfamily protein